MPRHARVCACADAVVRAKTRRAGDLSIASASDVASGIRRHDVLPTQMWEHWSFAVRIDLLRSFFDSHGPGVLSHKLCDLRFREWYVPLGYPWDAPEEHASACCGGGGGGVVLWPALSASRSSDGARIRAATRTFWPR